MIINLQNVEELIFSNKNIRDLLPEFRHFFDQWMLAVRISGMKNLGKQAVFDFMNSLDSSHIKKLEDFFQDVIQLDKIDNHILVNHANDISKIESELCQFEDFIGFCITRQKENLYLTFWK